MAEKEKPKFVDGSRVSNPKENAPEWIILNISFEVEKLIEQLKAYPYKYIDMVAKESRNKKLYLEINEYGKKPEHLRPGFAEGGEPELPPSSTVADAFGEDTEDIPF